MDEILFSVTAENLDTGLRGYPVGYCFTSTVDPIKGLSYSGVMVSEFSKMEPEAVIYLLYHGKQGTAEQIKEFSRELQTHAIVSPEVIKQICLLPRQGHPMKLLSASLLLCGMIEGKGDYRMDCLNLIAKIPEIVATIINYHAGWGPTPKSRPELGYMKNFVQMLNVPNGNKEDLGTILTLFNILHYDHGGGNLSTFVGKAVASGLEDMYGSLSAAMCALAGPRHGKANQDCLEFVQEILHQLGPKATPQELEEVLQKRLNDKELIYGFGHAVLREEDPRATLFYKIAAARYGKNPLVMMALLLREVGTKVLKSNPKITNPYPNVDAISGILLSAAGFPYPEYFTVLFGLARIVGIAIQIVDDRCVAREGKGTPIVRPRYLFKQREVKS